MAKHLAVAVYRLIVEGRFGALHSKLIAPPVSRPSKPNCTPVRVEPYKLETFLEITPIDSPKEIDFAPALCTISDPQTRILDAFS